MELTLNQYEAEALKESIPRCIDMVEAQIKELSHSRHSKSDTVKDAKRTLEKRVSLLKEIVKRL